MEIIKVDHLTKTYKNGVQALDDLFLTVKTGEVFTLLGKNGSGKSTLINILTTFLTPTSGNVTIFNKDIRKGAAEIRKQICCVAQSPSIDRYLSLEQNLLFQSKIYKVPMKEAKNRMKQLIKCFELEAYTKYPISTYSGGVKRRLDIALSMMSHPKIIFLDEPTVGMDIQSRMAMWKMIKQIKEEFGTTVFLTTHYLEEADELSDTICIMKDGKNMIQGTTQELRKFLNEERIEIQFASNKEVQNSFKLLEDELSNGNIHENKIITCNEKGKMQIENITQILLENNISFQGISRVQPTLEDIYLRYTSDREKKVM